MLKKVKKTSNEKKASPFLGPRCAWYHPHSRKSWLQLHRHPNELHHPVGLVDSDRRLGGKSGQSPPLESCWSKCMRVLGPDEDPTTRPFQMRTQKLAESKGRKSHPPETHAPSKE